jgi:hypothetical protein
MEMGFIIDVDHMSELTTQFVLDRCAAAARFSTTDIRPAYPTISAHASFRALSPRRHFGHEDDPGAGQRYTSSIWPHESEKSDAVATRILDLGGMLAPITSQLDSSSPAGSTVANTCAGTSRTYAQEFQHAVALTGSRSRGVGIGTDMCLNPMLGPRFGPLAAYGLHLEKAGPATPLIGRTEREKHNQAWAQDNGVVYQTPVSGQPRFYIPPEVDAGGRLNPLVAPQDSLVDLGIGGRYSFSVDCWRAMWLHEAGLGPSDGASGDLTDILRDSRHRSRRAPAWAAWRGPRASC